MKIALLSGGIAAVFLLVILLTLRWLNSQKPRTSAATHSAALGFATLQPGESPKSSKNMTSLVLLLKAPRSLTEDELRKAAAMAFGHSFNSAGDYTAEATPRAGLFVLQIPQMKMGVITANFPYYTDPGAVADGLRVFAAKRAVQQNTAWLSVDLLGRKPEGGQAAAYALIAKLLSQFADDNTLAILRTSDGSVVPYQKQFVADLADGNPDKIFAAPVVDPVIKTNAEDPELAGAAVEARAHWSQFVEAFNQRKPRQGFGVKKRFVADGDAEHMWVEVTSIKGTTITGKLSSDPITLTHMKIGQPVTLDASEVEDWIYSNGKTMTGGYQAKILENRQR